MFIGLMALGVHNLLKAIRLKKLNNPSLLMYYVSALTVIGLRIMLFADPVFEWPLSIYLGVLMSFPTILFMFVGFSQVMISIECIVAYKNLAHKENEHLPVVERNARIDKNNKRLRTVYIGATVAGLALVITFAVFTLILFFSKCSETSCAGTYQFTSVIGVLNILLWTLLMFSTIKFILQIRQRFGTQYGQATWRLTFVLFIFSMAFLLRGTFDICVTVFEPSQSNLGMGDAGFAIFLSSFYFVCEVLPLLVVFLQHRKDFKRCESENQKDSLVL